MSSGRDNQSYTSRTQQPKLMAEEGKQTSLSVVSGSSDSCFPDSASLSSKETQQEGVFGWQEAPQAQEQMKTH